MRFLSRLEAVAQWVGEVYTGAVLVSAVYAKTAPRLEPSFPGFLPFLAATQLQFSEVIHFNNKS